MVHIINVAVMDSPGKDKKKTIYCAETENMDSVSSNSWLMEPKLLAKQVTSNIQTY